MQDARKTRPPAPHTWRFVRAGGFDQVRIDTAADLQALDGLDQKLWVALSCPTDGLEFDARTLQLIDADGDGRIRVTELLAATKWACRLMKDPAELLAGRAALPLASIQDATDEGRRVLASARQILTNLGKGKANAVTVEDVADTTRIFAQTRFNGDGIVPADAADDEPTRQVIADIIACMGCDTDRSGKPGVSRPRLDAFFAEAQAFSDWWQKAEQAPDRILPLGEATPAAAAALDAVRAKAADYFARCRLAAYDAAAQAALNPHRAEYQAIAAQPLDAGAAEAAGFPLAHVEAGRPLPLGEGVNPAWAAAVGRFRELAVRPVLGEKDSLTESGWSAVAARFADYGAWTAAKAGAAVERLGLERVRQILAGDGRQAVGALIDRDNALADEANGIASVERLVRCHRDLAGLLNNFVCFRDFYDRDRKAIFQAGTLYLDQRSCQLCIRVGDIAAHAATAHLSQVYLAYCELTRRSTGQKMNIAAAFTNGDCDGLAVGRHGVFYDRSGGDWDATVVKIVENPVGIGQAFWSPYKRLVRWVEDLVAKRAAAADAAAADKLTSTVTAVGEAGAAGKPPAARPKFDVGVVAALGVAVGGITAALGMLLQAFFGLGFWMPLGVVALILLISGPSMVIAWLKLRRRSLGPLLDANGWAVNAKVRINIPFAKTLTQMARLPRGARRNLTDPYVKRHVVRNCVIVLVLLAALFGGLWYFGAIEWLAPGWLPKSNWVTSHQPPPSDPASPDTPARERN